MRSFTILFAFVASALALPHSAHRRFHPAPSTVDAALPATPLVQRADTKSLEAREPSLPIDTLGRCGGDSGFGCADGFCCSKWGHCGQTEDYCGAGCLFGACLSGGAAAPQYSAATAPAYTAPAPSPTAAPAPSAPASSASAAPASPSSLPDSSSPSASSYGSSSGGSGLGDTYKMYTGDGTTGAGWPSESEWMSFDDAWNSNLAHISGSCAAFNVPNNSDDETSNLKSAIQSVAQESGVDERFILAIMMQESGGCVRAPSTNYGVVNPGLMQDHNGKGSCNSLVGNSASTGGVLTPCPTDQIAQMIKDGVIGTASEPDGGDGLQQVLQQVGCDDVSKYYKAARMYNSGSIAAGGDLGAGIATHCYATDIANRLTGWTTATCGCNLD